MHRSSKVLVVEISLAVLGIGLLGVFRHPQLLPYEWHKLLHILGAVLLLGNIIVTAAWMFFAERANDRRVMRFAAEAVNWADVFFTVPGLFLLITNGDILSEQWGGVLGAGWITLSLALFAVSGIIWTGFLLRYQHRLIVLTRDAGADGIPDAVRAVLRKWYIGGALATLLPLVSFVLMFLKPPVW
jgi:uncharacterized membrane protein